MLPLQLDRMMCRLKRKSLRSSLALNHPDTKHISLPLGLTRVRQSGPGKRVVLFLCDPPVVIEHYEKLIASAPKDIGTLIVEMPGFGFSFPGENYNFSLEQQAELLISLLDTLQQRITCIVAPCVNAYTALRLAELRPDLTKAICVLQAPCWEEQILWAKRINNTHLMTPYFGQIIMALFARKVSKTWIGNALGDKTLGPSFITTADKALASNACFCLASLAQQWFGAKAAKPELKAPLVPCLSVWGMADRTHKVTNKESIMQLLPQANIVKVPDTGHFTELERPEIFWQILCDNIAI